MNFAVADNKKEVHSLAIFSSSSIILRYLKNDGTSVPTHVRSSFTHIFNIQCREDIFIMFGVVFLTLLECMVLGYVHIRKIVQIIL
jgi:hypothetical protein